MKKCNNCKYSELLFSLYMCNLENKKVTATECCQDWEEKKILVPEFKREDQSAQFCVFCSTKVDDCRCWPYHSY